MGECGIILYHLACGGEVNGLRGDDGVSLKVSMGGRGRQLVRHQLPCATTPL